jgi:membrane protease YdiL (CAAX protease family)
MTDSHAEPSDPTPANPWAAAAGQQPPPPPPAYGMAAGPTPGAPAPLRPIVTPKKVLGPGHIYWGLGQVWIGLGVGLGLNTLVGLVWFGLWLAKNGSSLSPTDLPGVSERVLTDLTSSPLFVLASLLTLWFGFLLGVWLASYRNGQRSLALDFGWRFVWRTDIALGIGLAVLLRLADAGFSALVTALGVNPKSIDNSGPILDQKGLALVVIVIAASVGAPIVEELFFRGLTLRALQKRWGAVVGIIGSSLLFGLLHAQPDSAGQLGLQSLWLVLFTATLGAVLAWVAVKTNRLGITVIAHVTFNLSALLIALIWS